MKNLQAFYAGAPLYIVEVDRTAGAQREGLRPYTWQTAWSMSEALHIAERYCDEDTYLISLYEKYGTGVCTHPVSLQEEESVKYTRVLRRFVVAHELWEYMESDRILDYLPETEEFI